MAGVQMRRTGIPIINIKEETLGIFGELSHYSTATPLSSFSQRERARAEPEALPWPIRSGRFAPANIKKVSGPGAPKMLHQCQGEEAVASSLASYFWHRERRSHASSRLAVELRQELTVLFWDECFLGRAWLRLGFWVISEMRFLIRAFSLSRNKAWI